MWSTHAHVPRCRDIAGNLLLEGSRTPKTRQARGANGGSLGSGRYRCKSETVRQVCRPTDKKRLAGKTQKRSRRRQLQLELP